MPLTKEQFIELRRRGLTPEQIAAFDGGGKPEQAKPPRGLVEDARQYWSGLDDNQKQAMLDVAGEMVGGTIGAVAGQGIASIPGAGAGAVAGRNLVARPLGKAMGLKPTERTATEELADTAGTFAAGAVGEGVGRAIPVAMRAGKNLVKKGLQKALKPNEEVGQLASKSGVPLTPAMLSDRKLMKGVETALERYPGSTEVVRNAREKAYDPWEKSVFKIGDDIHPKPVSDLEAGEALKEGLESNYAAQRDHFGPKYKDLSARVGKVPIDTADSRAVARDIVKNITPDTSRFFPPDTLSKVRRIANMGTEEFTGKPVTLFDASGKPMTMSEAPPAKSYLDAPGGAVRIDDSAQLTFDELRELRTQLLESERALNKSDAAFDRRAIPALREALDASIDKTLQGKDPQALADWRAINQDFKSVAEKTYSPTALKIDREKVPERLPGAIASKPTMVREAAGAIDPNTIRVVAGKPKVSGSPIDKVRRNRVDNLIDKSRTQDRHLVDQRVLNPRTLERNLDTGRAGYEELLNPGPVKEIEDSITLGKAITSPEFSYGNPSGTARLNLALSSGAGLAAAPFAEGDAGDKLGKAAGIAAGVYFTPKMAAKALTSQRLTKALMDKSPVVSGPMGGALSGLLGRGMYMDEIPSPGPVIDEEEIARRVRLRQRNDLPAMMPR